MGTLAASDAILIAAARAQPSRTDLRPIYKPSALLTLRALGTPVDGVISDAAGYERSRRLDGALLAYDRGDAPLGSYRLPPERGARSYLVTRFSDDPVVALSDDRGDWIVFLDPAAQPAGQGRLGNVVVLLIRTGVGAAG